MNFQKLYGKRIICFSKTELESLHKTHELAALKRQVGKMGLTEEYLQRAYDQKDFEMIKSIVEPVGKHTATDRDLHEVFAAWNIFLPFYEEGSEICFELGSKFIPEKTPITSLEELNTLREDVFGDFIVKSSDGYRIIQLKRYRGELDEENLHQFILSCLNKYGRNFGDTNLLIILQTRSDKNELDMGLFKGLNEKLKHDYLEIKGEVLIAFNKDREQSVIAQVHPDHTIIAKNINWASGYPPK